MTRWVAYGTFGVAVLWVAVAWLPTVAGCNPGATCCPTVAPISTPLPMPAAIARPSPAPFKPEARITGPSESQPGDLVILKSEGSQARKFGWLVFPASMARFALPVEGGTSVIFASRQPADVDFALIAVAGDEFATAVQTVHNGTAPGPSPPVPPGPTPPVPPNPDPPLPVPPDYASLTQAIIRYGAEVDPQHRSSGAVKLVAVCDQQAAAIGAGTYQTIDDALVGFRKAAADSLTWAENAAWWPATTKLKADLGRLDQAGKLSDLNGMRQALTAIAAGLRQVR